jgi:hypothetical protein
MVFEADEVFNSMFLLTFKLKTLLFTVAGSPLFSFDKVEFKSVQLLPVQRIDSENLLIFEYQYLIIL